MRAPAASPPCACLLPVPGKARRMPHRLLALLLAAAAAAAAFADSSASPAPATLRPITHEDVWLMKRVANPRPSPDGRWVVFSVTQPAYDAKEQTADLWLKSLTDDTPARQLTFTKAAESGAAWSPDSTRLAFTARREGDEAAQIYVLHLTAGGEAERVTDLTLGARSPEWNPDGTRLLFISFIYPDAADEPAIKRAAKERKDRKFTGRAYEAFPARFWDNWLDDRQARPFVQEARAGATPRQLLAGTALTAQPGFGGSVGADGPGFVAEWTPDGAGIVFVASLNRHQAAYAQVDSQLFTLALAGGEPTQLTSDAGNYGQPAFTADGRTLLCTFNANNDEVYNLTELVGFAWPFTGERRHLTPGLDRSISSFAQPAGSDRLWFTSEHAGLEKLYSVPLAGGEVRAEASPDTGAIGALDAGGAALTGTWETAGRPPEVFRFDGGPRALTDFNATRVAQLDLPPVEHFWFKSSRGRDIHNLLVKPAGFDPTKKYPVWTVIHGGFAGMWRDAFSLRWNYHLLARPGYVLLLTNYTGSTGFGAAFAQRIKQDPLATPGDEINEAVDEAERRFPFIDGARLAAGGASYGGHLANWLQATTTRYRCIISHAGLMDLAAQWSTSDTIYGREMQNGGPPWGDSRVWTAQSPLLQAGNHAAGTGFKSPILITVGEQDFRVPVNNALANFALQQRLQVPSRLIVFPDENHWILKGENSRYWYGEVHAWLERYLR